VVRVRDAWISGACSIVLSASSHSFIPEGATILNLPTRPARHHATSVPSFTRNDCPRTREIDAHHHAKHALKHQRSAKRDGAAVGLLVPGVAGLATLLVPGDAVILVMIRLYLDDFGTNAFDSR